MNSKEYKLPDGRTVVFWYDENDIGQITLEAMDSLISMITEKWISCSDRLPEHTGFYLIQHSRECCADEMAVAFYSVEEHEIDPDDCWEFSPVGDAQEVIAWMPLPKPYQEDRK